MNGNPRTGKLLRQDHGTGRLMLALPQVFPGPLLARPALINILFRAFISAGICLSY